MWHNRQGIGTNLQRGGKKTGDKIFDDNPLKVETDLTREGTGKTDAKGGTKGIDKSKS